MKKIFFIICLIIVSQKAFALNDEKFAFFISPKNWGLVKPSLYPPFIKISFIKKEIAICRPTLNLATQKTSLTLEEYTNEAKKSHIKEPKTTYRILDKITLPQGIAYICQINKNINSDIFELLQMIFVYDGYAYILTGACKKSEILKNYEIFMNVFKSFTIIEDLFSLVSENQKPELIRKFNELSALLKSSNNKQIKKNITFFENYLDKKFKNLGKYFQILLIQKAYKK